MSSNSKLLKQIQNDFYYFLRGSSNQFQLEVCPIGNLTSIQSLEIYRRGYKARLIEVLGDSFESCWWVLGDELFFDLASRYIDLYPSQVDDLDQYGESFPAFLKQEQLRIIPDSKFNFLNNLAEFEIIFKKIFHKKNVLAPKIDWNVFFDENETVELKLSSSSLLFQSTNDVYEIWKLRKENQRSLDEIIFRNPLLAVVYKFNSQVYVKKLSQIEFFAIQKISEGQSILQTLDSIELQYPNIESSEVEALFSTLRELPIFEIGN